MAHAETQHTSNHNEHKHPTNTAHKDTHSDHNTTEHDIHEHTTAVNEPNNTHDMAHAETHHANDNHAAPAVHHAAETHAADHSAPHEETHTAHTTPPTPTTARHAAPAHHAPSGNKAPIFKAIDHLYAAGDNLGKSILDTATGIRAGLDKTLRQSDPGDAPKQSIFKKPFTIAGDLIDATVLNIGRRATEITSEIIRPTRSIYRTITRPVFHPIDTVKHPLKYLANPARIITSAARVGGQIINAPARIVDEALNRGIKRPVQKIPLIGKYLGSAVKFASRITKAIRSGFEWATSWINTADEGLKKYQN
ncbi:hypothetical protein HYW82_01575 [Candidatus Peregrinibacteria bacterium]|nr:hypothetical protein [Candidatus Peregrinibacteria bacterium]